jgi:hypothetical protein
MGLRFHRSVKILPGVRLNIGKTGTSISIGGGGLTHTIGSKNSRTTVSVPGTGLSYTKVHPHNPPPPVPPPLPTGSGLPANARTPSSAKFFYIVGVALLVIWLLAKVGEQSKRDIGSTAASSPSISAVPEVTSSRSPQRRALPQYPSAKRPSDLPSVTASPALSRSPPPTLSMAPAPLQSWQSNAARIQPSPSPEYSAPAKRTYRVANISAGDGLNLRSGPGLDFAAILEIPYGTRGITLGRKRAANGPTMWQEIVVAGRTGWVNEIYLEAEGP